MSDQFEKSSDYLMDNEEEAIRLALKTKPEDVVTQAFHCGIHEGARVLDVGCGSGKTTEVLHALVGPTGEVVGVDASEHRLNYARKHFGGKEGISFVRADFTQPMDDLGTFDFVWVRFILEYFYREAPAIVANLTRNLKPDGRMCLLDLDNNSMNHYPILPEMERLLEQLMLYVQEHFNFDSWAGRKLHAHLYDLGYRDIRAHVVAHHLIYGEPREEDAFNWDRKIKMWTETVPEVFESYPGGIAGVRDDIARMASDPRRITYTPMVICTGLKPLV